MGVLVAKPLDRFDAGPEACFQFRTPNDFELACYFCRLSNGNFTRMDGRDLERCLKAGVMPRAPRDHSPNCEKQVTLKLKMFPGTIGFVPLVFKHMSPHYTDTYPEMIFNVRCGHGQFEFKIPKSDKPTIVACAYYFNGGWSLLSIIASKHPAFTETGINVQEFWRHTR